MPRPISTIMTLALTAGFGYTVEQVANNHWQAGSDAERYHATTVGMVATRDLTTSVGLLNRQVPASVLETAGSSLSFVVDLGAGVSTQGHDPVLLEIQEVHQAHRHAFAYAVAVDGVTVHVRTFAELLNAPMTWFARVERSLIRDPRQVRVTLTNLGPTPVAIANVWGHGDFYRQARDQGMAAPLRVLTYVAQAIDHDVQFPPTEDFSRGIMYGTSYLQASATDHLTAIDRFLDAGNRHKLPYALMQSCWWGHTGMDADGRGGYLGDIRYNQVVYDQVEDRFHLTTPNKWGNTPWQSLNNDASMALKQDKLRRSARHFANRYALMQATTPDLPAPDLVMEWGVSYWEDGGDFSFAVVAAALRDGVTLNPQDGLDPQEIAWMQKNIAVYNDQIAQAYQDGLGYDAVIVRQGVVTPPTRHFVDRLFTHTLEAKLFPSYDDRLPGWVGGVGPRMWPSSEMYQFSDPRHHLYTISVGRLACANLEITMLKGDDLSRYLRRAFANGMDFLAMFNPKGPTNVEKQIAIADQVRDQPCPDEPEYLNHVLDLDLLRDGRANFLEQPPVGITVTGLALALPKGGTNMSDGYLYPTDPQVPGMLTCRLTDPEGFARGLTLRLEGRTTTGSMTVLAGTDVNHLKLVHTFTMGEKLNWFNAHAANTIDLTGVARGAQVLYVRLVLTGGGKAVSVRALQAYLPWAQPTGRLQGRADTYGERRLQNIWIQHRAVGERLRTAYVTKAGGADGVCQQYDALVKEGRLGDGIRLLAAEIAQVLPARFAVAGQGPLGRLPLEVQLPAAMDAAVVTVLAHSDTTTRFTVFTESAVPMRLRWRGGERMPEHIRQDGNGVWTVTWRTGTTADGWVSIDMQPQQPPISTPRSTTFFARVDQISPNLVVELQDVTVGDFSRARLQVIPAPTCTYARPDNVNQPKPQVHDLAEITVDAQGLATAIRLRAGVARGRITAFTPAPLRAANPHNGRVTLDNGLVFELSYNKDHTRLDLEDLKGLAIAHEIAKVERAIQPGLNVEILYTPDYPAGIPPRIRWMRQVPPSE